MLILISAGHKTVRAANVQMTSVLLTVSDLSRARAFYSQVLQFTFVSEVHQADRTIDTMRLGEEVILLSAPKTAGRPVPAEMQSNDRLFEHLAIVVSNMDAAYQRLLDHHTSMVSTSPQTLPHWNFDAAYIRALYFRDLDGHFLELIQFPADKGLPRWHRREGPLFLGIDHTAIVVRDIKKSRDFYRDVLGLTLEGESLNYGREQELLSRVPGARVQIDSLRGVKGPGIELLQYVEPGTTDIFPGNPTPNDSLYCQINLVANREDWKGGFLRHDPDGHAFSLSDQSANAPRFEYMREALYQHWPLYLMEGAELGVFMIVALYFSLALEHPASPLRRRIKSAMLRRFLFGLAIGVTVVALIYSPWGRLSGAQFNPAVTLARLSINRIEPWDALFYILAQFLGGWLLLVLAGFPFRRAAAHKKVKWVATAPGKMGSAAAFIAEFIISFVILFSLLIVIHYPAVEWWIGIVAGVLLCAFITFESPFSGMSLNPARTMASALPAQSWKAIWIYFLSPPLAMFLAARACRWLIDS